MTTESGRRHVLRYGEGGQLFNMIGILDDGPGIHEAVAHEETIALLIPKTSVRACLLSARAPLDAAVEASTISRADHRYSEKWGSIH